MRLYFPEQLAEGQTCVLSPEQSHYATIVLRQRAGDTLHLFNAEDGAWEAVIVTPHKRRTEVEIKQQVRAGETLLPLSLAFAPIKHQALVFLVEKATELGVTHLYPVITQRCNVSRINLLRLRANVLEATQQCERLAPPIVAEPQALDRFLADYPQNHALLLAKERSAAPPLIEVLHATQKPVTFLIGPEGGFTEQEFQMMERYDAVKSFSLGQRILRAETAALAALSVSVCMSDSL